MSYSQFMAGLKRAGVELDRKSLADIAARDPQAFGALVQSARTALSA
jgi:large subunit ribosomal protein L20